MLMEDAKELTEKFSEKIYIPQHGGDTLNAGNKYPAENKIDEFLNSTAKILLIQGEAKSGKTTLLL